MSSRNLRLMSPGEVEQEYDLTITTTTDTATVVEGTLTFDVPFKSAPSIKSARVVESTGRLAIAGADTVTVSGLKGFINPNGANLGAGTLTLKVIVAGQLDQ